MDKYCYKRLSFDASIVQSNRQYFLCAKDKNFYGLLLKSLKTIPNNPKKFKRYPLLTPSKNIKNFIHRDFIYYELICLKFKEEEKESEKIVTIKTNNKEITIEYSSKFINILEEEIKDFFWENVDGEIDIEGLIFCPNWNSK